MFVKDLSISDISTNKGCLPCKMSYTPNFLDSVGQMLFRFLYDQFFQSAFFALWIALRGLLPKAETMILNYYYRPTTSILLTSANSVDGDDGDWQDTSYTQILLLLLV